MGETERRGSGLGRRAAQIVNGHRIVDEAINGHVICDCGSRFVTPLDHAGHVVSIMREAGLVATGASWTSRTPRDG